MAEEQTISTAEMAPNAGEIAKVLHDLQGTIHFVIKQLRPSHVAENRKKNCTLMIPVWFVKEHGDKFQGIVALQSRLSTEPWTVQLSIQRFKNPKSPGPRPPEIKFGKGWKAFATSNELSVGDALIFELTGVSEFEVHIIRKTVGKPASASSSHAPEKRPIDSELSQKNGNNESSGAGCTQNLASERSEGSVDDLSNWVAKKRKVGDDQVVVSASQSALQNSSCMNSHPLELDNEKASLLEMSHASQSSQEPPGDESEQNAGSRIVHVQMESPHTQTSLPSFIQRLVEYNNHDSAGNTCGARFEVPFSFLETHGVQLQHHVKLQGLREDSPIRTVTCSQNVLKDGEDSIKPGALWLGWGDFVRENGLRAGQELALTLTSESFFVVREVSEIVMGYTKLSSGLELS